LFFGLTADGFSSLPYGVYGLSYFICSFFIRWYGIKIFNGYLLIVPILAGFFTLVLSSMVYFIESFFFVQKVLTLKWIQSLILFEVLPTALIAVPLFQLLIMIDARLKLRLAERKF
ncbi:MAG: hypothetical protein OEY59_06875, partial [Deltaproteobacteria bacterium]|nr:hypothetical protein [Deltaproteobacteria bacterium]